MITAVVPVSPIKSHPDTTILDDTLDSIRHHLPNAEIIVTFDGVRAEHENRRADYEEFIRRALWRMDKYYGNTMPCIFDTHTHQAGMLRSVLSEIHTPLLMYVESDTPLVTDELIDWPKITDYIMAGHADLVRLHHEAVIPDVHQPMMHGLHDGFMRTSQFSARPHIASVAYYRRVLGGHFSANARCFIEDVMHGICDEAVKIDGMQGWQQHKLVIYHPDGNIKRSVHSDGRAGEPKLDSTQVF